MHLTKNAASRYVTGLAASLLLLGAPAAWSQVVNLNAAPTATTLPDGQTVPMWGFQCVDAGGATATCAASNPSAGANWSPVVITVPYTGAGTSLTINLTNSLKFTTAKSATNTVPTSLVIVGQLGGGLGAGGKTVLSPVHAPQGVTWSIPGSPTSTNTPPAQPPRVQSFGTEVAAGTAAQLTWTNLRPGTYLIESGTHPSIQGPMGLYGVLVVTAPATTGTGGTKPAQAYPNSASVNPYQYDADLAVVLSEIDPVQNAAVAAAVATDGFAETTVWSGQIGGCAAPGVQPTCYPPTVNYSPRYYLVNGVSFDRTNLGAATAQLLAPLTAAIPADPTTTPPTAAVPATPAAATTGNVIVRLVNAGLRMHVPAMVGLPFTLLAEDGNVLPGVPRIQNEVFLAAGKTYDVSVKPAQSGGAYTPATYPLFDRQLSLSTNNQRDGGMQSYVAVSGGAASGVGVTAAKGGSNAALGGVSAKTFYCVSGTPLSITDPARGVLGGTTGANGVALSATGTNTLPGTIVVQSNGTFSYTPPTTGACGGQFTINVNGTTAVTETIAECDSTSNTTTGCPIGKKPILASDAFTSTNAQRLAINPPGILLNDVDPSGLKLAVDPTTITQTIGALTSLTVNADGSFNAIAPAPGSYSFTYNVKNEQGTAADQVATVTLNFPAGSGLKVKLQDAVNGSEITDYRWIIEEDRTFWIDPKCQVNTTPRPLDSYGHTCAPLPVEALGYNFHSAGMPVVATGCVGSVSCESGQTVLHQTAVCDIGNGVCDTTSGRTSRTELKPEMVALDPNKHYFLSVMPGDGINPTVKGVGGPVKTLTGTRQFSPALDCTNYAVDFAPGTGSCGHSMGGAQVGPQFDPQGNPVPPAVTISLAQTPLPTAQIAVLVYEDDYPLNGENDAGGGVDILAPFEPGLGGFQVELLDQAGGLGDSTGQITYDMFNMPVGNALAGTKDVMTGNDACPLVTDKNGQGIVGMIVTCPTYESDGTTLSPLAGQALVQNLYPGLYEVNAFPSADRIARGEEWLQTNTLDGGKPHEAFIRPGEPAFFQEFGPGGFHVQIGFANPAIINNRRTNASHTGICDPQIKDAKGVVIGGGGGLVCNSSVTGHVHGNHMSRTPDERTYDTGSYDAFKFSACYVSLGLPDAQDIAFAKCDANGNFTMTGLPDGTYKLAVFDQWNDIMLDGLITAVTVNGDTPVTVTATQWRTNLYTRAYIDSDGNGIPNRDAKGNDQEGGLALVPMTIRYRDGSVGFKNTTDLNGYATFNEVFPLMNWLVVEPDTSRYKPTGEHVVYDAGGPDDCSPIATAANRPCSKTAAFLAGTVESNSLPTALRVPGAVYCADADCNAATDSILNGPYYAGATASSGPATGLSSGRIDPPWHTEAWQGLLGQHSFIDFGMKPFAPGENGGISGLVVYASTRPFDDPTLLVQNQWAPAVPNVQVNLYQEGTAADGSKTLTLVDSTLTSSWDKWAQGFRTNGDGKTPLTVSGTNADGTTFSNASVPNMNCPGQDPTSGFFATLAGSKMWLDTPDASGNKKTIAYNSQFKCFDGWSMLNQIQPAPYDGKYAFPSVVDRNPVTGRPSGTGALNGVPNTTGPDGTNCTICVKNPDDGNPMLPTGTYVVEVVVPTGYEIVKEEDKNILMGDIYIAPLAQQFGSISNVFILPDQAEINAYYNANNLANVNNTTSLGVVNLPRSDFAMVTEQIWPCAGEMRIVPDTMSLFPTVGQTAPFAGASRPLCDRKEVKVVDQMSANTKFFIYTKNHIAGHFVGGMTNDMASEFDPFSPQFGEKFGVPNLPIRMRDFNGNEVTRVYGDQWGAYNGMFFSSWEVNPPNPTGYAPQMSIACMNDPGPILDNDPTSATYNQMITDPAYNVAYSNFCYEIPFMPGFTAYMDTPVTPVQAFADHYNLPDAEYPDGTPMIRRADFKGTSGKNIGPWAADTTGALTLTAFGDRPVQNPQYVGPSATTAPYNQKTVTRHYGFGSYQCSATDVASGTNGCKAVSSVTIGGLPATIVGGSWTDGSIQVLVPSNLPPCLIQQQNAPSQQNCGEVVITAGNGKQSIDAITVTIGGKTPTYITQSSPSSTVFGEFYPNPIQTAIDQATAGDLIIVDAGAYRESLIMWKPLRLQGVGAGSVTINADAHPAGKMDAWRRRMTCIFGLTVQGVPNLGNTKYDASGQWTCPANMYFSADRIPYEGFVGWDATSNGNLAQVLQEPSLMGAYEGAGVTVIGRGVNQDGIAAGTNDYWGQVNGSGFYPDGTRYLNATTDCVARAPKSAELDYAKSNYLCNPSAIDGLTITNSSQGGGGIYMHGWAHNLQIANNRVTSNAGTLAGGINVGQGEKPEVFTVDNNVCFADPAAAPALTPLCPPVPAGLQLNQAVPFQFNVNVRVHHNEVIANASIGDALFSGVPTGAGGINVASGADNYQIDHNWIAANLTGGDGGGIAHAGVSFNGRINNNYVLFNQANNPTLPVDGGGIVIMGAQEDRVLPNGQECGNSVLDVDCPPGMGEGTGAGLVIDSNLILGNSAEDGSGGGVRLRQTNGTEMASFLTNPAMWYGITVTNNIIVNNVAGWDGAGISLQDSFKTQIINNTISSNDTTASAGVLFKTLGAVDAASPPPGCLPTPDPLQPQAAGCLDNNGPHIPQPAGLVTMQNTPNMMAQFTSQVVCPAGFGYGDATDSAASLVNGRCVLVSLPQVANDIFWQNRAFHVEIVDSNGLPVSGNAANVTGTGLYSHQNIVALLPYLVYGTTKGVQQTTGQCGATSDGTQLYWDIGVRMDALPTVAGHNLVFNAATVGTTYGVTAGVNAADGGAIALSTFNTLLSDNVNLLNVNGVASFYPDGTAHSSVVPVSGQYCNGARVPPENCATSQQGANNIGMCKGFFTPAGQSETAGVSTPFLFNGIAASATVDEGNNWINMTYGPLSLTRPTATTTTATELLISTASVAAPTAAYTLAANSAALWAGNAAVAPATDFFGQPRPATRPSLGAVEYVPPPPTITTIAPLQGTQGDAVVVTLTGTNFTPATTIAVAGGGVTVSNVTWASTTSLSATFTIAPTATTGARAVTVTTLGGTSAGSTTFTVVAPLPPTLATITPASTVAPATGSSSVPVTITGANFTTTGTTVTVTGGVLATVNSVSADGTTITATLTVPSTAGGVQSVTVTNPAATSNALAFTVYAPASLKTISPASGYRGDSYAVTLSGANLTGATLAVSDPGVAVSNVVVNSATSISATFTVSPTMSLGAYSVTATNAYGTGTAVTFTVTNPPVPTLTLLAPATGIRGNVYQVALTGTDFTTAGTTVAVTGNAGVTVSNVVVNSQKNGATATFTVATNASTFTPANIRVVTPGGTSGAKTFAVTVAPNATLTSISPASAERGKVVSVTLGGGNFTTNGTTVTVSGGNIAVSAVNVTSPTTATATFTIGATAAIGVRSVTLANSNGVGSTLANSFTVAGPTVTSLTPNSATAGTTVPVTIVGTSLGTVSTVTVNGTGVTASNVVPAANGLSVTANLAIADVAAAIGVHTLTVTDTSGAVSNGVGFTVNSPGLPVLGSISPVSAQRGSSYTVTLSGSNLAEVNAVQVSGTGVTVSGITPSADGTTVTATFAIAANATASARSVTVSDAGGQSGPVTFTVLAPTLASVSPATGVRGTTVPVTLTGTGLSGATALTVSGTGITYVINSSTATTVSATLTIAANAAVGNRTISVTAPGGTTGTVTFAVAAPVPTINTISPASGARGTAPSVTITGTGLTGAAVTVSGTRVAVSGTTATATSVTATFTIAGNAATGARTVTVTTAGGSKTTTFTVN